MPAVGKVIVLVVPGLNVTPPDDANALGAPGAAANAPFVPVTRLCTPPVALGSLNVIACPADMRRLVGASKEKEPIVNVADPPLVDGAVVLVASGVVAWPVPGLVLVEPVAPVLPPVLGVALSHPARMSIATRQAAIADKARLRIGISLLEFSI